MNYMWIRLFDWWNVDPEELQRQVTEYNSRGAARKISAYLLLAPAVLSIVVVCAINLTTHQAVRDPYVLARIMIFLVLTLAAYKGWQVALAFSMVLVTLYQAYAIVMVGVRFLNERVTASLNSS